VRFRKSRSFQSDEVEICQKYSSRTNENEEQTPGCSFEFETTLISFILTFVAMLCKETGTELD